METLIYRKNNPDKVKESIKKWHSKNQERVRAYTKIYRKNNRDRILQGYKVNKIKNRARYAEYQVRRESDKIQRTPVYANIGRMKEIYEMAQLITNYTGVKMHVDHIIPLRGRHVCGFHVENNLRVVDAETNMKKGNRV